MMRSVWCGLAVVTLMAVARSAVAEPYLAVREGYNCAGCHTNVTGGGKRTDIVITHAKDILRYPTFLGTFSKPADKFTGEINKYVSIGSDLRASDTLTFQDKGVNGEVSNNKVFRGRLEENSIEVNQAEGYFEVRLIPEMLTVYLDQRFAPSTDTREAWAMLRGLPVNGFVKVGRMFLPYGLQLRDDTSFIRGGSNGSATTNFSFNQYQAAGEIGIAPGPYSAIVAVSEGASGDRSVWVTSTVSAMWTELPVVRSVLLGGSAAYLGGGSDNVEFGFFGGTNLGPVTVLAEADFLSAQTQTSGRQGGFVAYGELDYLLFGWLNLKGTVDYADYDGDFNRRGDDSENRFRVGMDPFLNRFSQLSIFYQIGNGVESRPDHNQNLLIFEVHVFL